MDNIKSQHDIEDLASRLSAAVCTPPGLLLVNRAVLIDRVKLIEETITGRVVPFGESFSVDGLIPEHWIDLTGHLVESFPSLVKLAEGKPDWNYQVDSSEFRFVCSWCHNSATFSGITEAKRAGWSSVDDPVGNSWDFCPDSDCQEGAQRYIDCMAVYNRAITRQ